MSMRKCCLSYLIVGFVLAACADQASSLVVDKSGPQAPINAPDSGVFQAGDGPSELLPEPEDPTSNGASGPANAGEGGGGEAGSRGGSNSGESGGSNVGEEPEGGGGGAPVPEPSTLLLVGTGLAGAALLRRRRKRNVTD